MLSSRSIDDICVRDDFPDMTIIAVKIKSSSLVQVVDLAILALHRGAAEGSLFVLQPLKDFIEFLVRRQKSVVVRIELFHSAEVEREEFIDSHRSEALPKPLVL